MPAQIVDELDDSGNAMEPGDLSGLEATPAAPAQAVTAQAILDGEDVPEKYRGKSASDLLRIVQDQESHIGKQGSELGDLRGQVGTLRGLVDNALDLRETGSIGREDVGTEEDLVDENDFITHPRDAVTKTVKRETRDTNNRLAQLEKQNAALEFTRRHPTAQTDVESAEFVKFVQGTATRGRLANQAFSDLKNIDFEAAEELWELWDDYQTMMPESQETETSTDETASHEATSQEEDPKPTKEAPAMVKTGSSGDVGGSTKPIYSQQALNRLQEENPTLFWASDTQAKIQAAYADGRVQQD
jgi:hypothetical protein